MKLIDNIYNVINHIILDLKSTRERILWVSMAIFIFTLIFSKDSIICGLVSGWVTICLTFYFQSKNQEAKHKHDLNIMDIKGFNPISEKNPDEN